MTDFEQFLAPDSDFSRRAALSAQAKAENSGMGSVEDDISAMFESNHGSLSQVSLAGVMAPVTSPDIFASFASHGTSSQHQGMSGLARTSSMSQAALANHTAHFSNASFSAAFNTFMPTFAAPTPPPPPSAGLHRYHSAPSASLQALAEDAFTQIPPMGVPNSTMGSPLFPEEGLIPITELDVERSGSGNSMTEFEQFLSPECDFSRRAALSAQAKPENSEMFANLFPPGKSTELLRQKSLPVPPVTIVPKQDPMDEQHSEESISGTSDDNTLVNGLKVSIYDDLFSSWPPSPGTAGGKRARVFAGESETLSGTAENPKSFRLNNQNGLIRHASLPTPAAAAATTNPSDDHYVQMRSRAKRGCATHPRSIAERVRRTRISERMKKLQDLVPNMEKTTNTSDMLDETVEYVKSLQLQVSELNATIAQLKAGTMSHSGS